MPRLDIARTTVPSTYAAAPVVALTFTTADPANNHQIRATGREKLIVRNNHATIAYTITITSSVDVYGRTKDVTAYSIPALATVTIGPFPLEGWVQTNGYINVDAANASLLLAVEVLP